MSTAAARWAAKQQGSNSDDIDIEALINQAVESAKNAILDEITSLINSKLDKLQKDIQARDATIIELQNENAELETQLHNQGQTLETLRLLRELPIC